MGKKGKWFGAVKKVFSPESKEKKEEVILLPRNPLAFYRFYSGFLLRSVLGSEEIWGFLIRIVNNSVA